MRHEISSDPSSQQPHESSVNIHLGSTINHKVAQRQKQETVEECLQYRVYTVLEIWPRVPPNPLFDVWLRECTGFGTQRPSCL